MQCFHPWKPPANLGLKPTLTLRCGQCQGCRLERTRQWAVRCIHEKQLHELNTYVTLTIEGPIPGMSLDHTLFQKFIKRLRKKFSQTTIRYYMCGEYGEKCLACDHNPCQCGRRIPGRPHFHAILFGIDFQDKYPWRRNHQGDQLYRSATLERLWKHGNSEIGAVTFQSAAYVARYVMKKITGDMATSHYTWIDEHGEMHSRTPEYNRMSLRDAIGKGWYDRYKNDVYPSDQVITNGHPSPPPRYYDKLLSRERPHVHAEIKRRRNLQALQPERKLDNTAERLHTKEIVQAARTKLLKRTIS